MIFSQTKSILLAMKAVARGLTPSLADTTTVVLDEIFSFFNYTDMPYRLNIF